MKRYLARFWSDARGSSAVEFAVILPAMLAAAIGIADVGYNVYQRGDLEAAMRSGAQYFMNGGKDIETAVAIVDSAWTYKPEGAAVRSDQFCMCGTAEGVATGCVPIVHTLSAIIALRRRSSSRGLSRKPNTKPRKLCG
jgi:Flp pilus assembly protein TadG